jgi:hypothetical protein
MMRQHWLDEAVMVAVALVVGATAGVVVAAASGDAAAINYRCSNRYY